MYFEFVCFHFLKHKSHHQKKKLFPHIKKYLKVIIVPHRISKYSQRIEMRNQYKTIRRKAITWKISPIIGKRDWIEGRRFFRLCFDEEPVLLKY